MKQKKRTILASIAVFAMVAMASPVMAEPNDHEMPAQNDPFWTFFAQMNHPTDTENCTTAVTNYVNGLGYGEERRQAELQGMLGFCTGVSTMASQMQTDMTAEGVLTSLFDNTTDWHNMTGLYFQKSENGSPMGRISFSETIDFMSYRFFNFMNNFGTMVQFNDGYISLNAAMVPDMINYGASLTMYGLDFDEVPDIYVSSGATMRKAIEGTDVSGITYDSSAGTITFTPGHFSSFRVVEKGTTVSTMKIGHLSKRSVKYNARKSTFQVRMKGRGLRGENVNCTLGFNGARYVSSSNNGRTMRCTFSMEDFSTTGYYPLTVSVPGRGEVTRANAIRIR